MSSSSLYEPEEDDEASDSDIDTGNEASRVLRSSPLSRKTRLSSSFTQLNGDSSYRLAQAPKRPSRVQMLEHLQTSLSQESVGAYSDLLARTTDELTSETKIGSGRFQSTQAGIVIWTPKEKEIFFSVLDKKGKDGIADIAHAIGTKSELEVQEYLRLLHRGLEWQHLKDRHSRTIVLGDVPAAEELSGECCDMLDDYAELVALKEEQDENVAGRHEHRDMWVIDREKAELVEEIESQGGSHPAAGSSVYHTAGLLNVPKWIRLSERFFMNFGGQRFEDNWVNVAYAGESPAMTAEALAEFYALTISVTRRLIQSALFFAMSRLRNMRETGNIKAKVVKSRDIRTALDVLKMKRDGYDFWTGLARRCSLEVKDSRHRKGWKSVRLNHDEVEDMLSGKVAIDAESNRSTSRHRSESRRWGETDGEQTDSGEDDDESRSEFEPRRSPVPPAPPSPEFSDEELPLDIEDEHAEQEDQKASCLGELEVWEALDRPAPSFLVAIKEESQNSKTRKPTGERKSKQELVDWRESTLYHSDWEEYGHEVYDIYEEISEMRRKRRRIDSSRDPSPSEHGHGKPTDEVYADPTSGEYVQPTEDINPSEDSQDMEMDAPDQDKPIPQDEDSHLRESDAEPQIKQAPNKRATDDSEPPSPLIKPAYRSPILTRRSIKPEPKQKDNSSSSDDDLPLALRRYLSSEQDDNDGMPLYSQPMTPTDWTSD
ncbi:hypothetical protein BDV23DRAFT_179708 [Aspergillus alliaceus]|uniref:Myb-like domain-containing protein n=1 Tax=Petromyces alliaceus TaxID=209559 RepID=A0A5N7CKC6_PETAA|nr:hypothetical protein BDV23DRAFT_179708 [Aspergillus alliaceus]